jgi:hypothetical protein
MLPSTNLVRALKPALAMTSVACWFYIAALLIYLVPVTWVVTVVLARWLKKKLGEMLWSAWVVFLSVSALAYALLAHWLDSTTSSHFGNAHLAIFWLQALVFFGVFAYPSIEQPSR